MCCFSWAFPGGIFDFAVSSTPSQKQGRDCRSWTPEFGNLQLEQLELRHQVVQLAHIIHFTAITAIATIATDFLPPRSISTLWEESIVEGFAATSRRSRSTRCIWKCSSFFVSHSVHVLFKCLCPVLCHVSKDPLDSGIHILASDICASTGDEKDVRVLFEIGLAYSSNKNPVSYDMMRMYDENLVNSWGRRLTQTSGLHKLPSRKAKFLQLPNSSGLFPGLVRQFEKYHWNLEPVRVRPQEDSLEVSWSEECWSLLKNVEDRLGQSWYRSFAMSWYVLIWVWASMDGTPYDSGLAFGNIIWTINRQNCDLTMTRQRSNGFALPLWGSSWHLLGEMRES